MSAIDRRCWGASQVSCHDGGGAKRIEDAWACPNCDEHHIGVIAPEKCAECGWKEDPRYIGELEREHREVQDAIDGSLDLSEALRDKMKGLLGNLTEKERGIVRERYGLEEFIE